MTPDQIDTAIAEWIGWTEIHHVEESRRLYGMRPKSEDWKYRLEAVPQFHKCLNAMHDAEKGLGEDLDMWVDYLEWINYEPDATAIQRAEALLRTIGKWKEAE